MEINIEDLLPVASYAKEFAGRTQNRSLRISTGFRNIDMALHGGLNADLYVMTAETSIGKSAFMEALAGNMASDGINVLYFSFEMGHEEFIARGISAESYREHIINPERCVYSAGDILYRVYDDITKDFIAIPYEKYKDYAETFFTKQGRNFYIVECGMSSVSAHDISELTLQFQKSHPEQRLVIFIDYLQLIAPDKNDRAQIDRKTKVDVSVKTLKSLSNTAHIPVFIVSSVSRTTYSKGQSIGTAKESGDTEYTAGVLLGWDWIGVTDARNKEEAEKEKARCQRRGYRKMKLSVLKFRNAERDNGTTLYYYPAYNYFTDKDPAIGSDSTVYFGQPHSAIGSWITMPDRIFSD